jgi:transcriptional regulator with XRE-family HTH domain
MERPRSLTRAIRVPSVPVVARTAINSTAGSVRAELARRGITGRELAAALGRSERTVRRRLSGDLPFTVDELTAVAGFLDIPVGSLLPEPERAA